MIDITNQFGLDKLTFKQRIQWVKKHKNNLWDMQEKAENIPKYAAAVLAYTDTLAGKATGHLVGMDAAASGCQCMAALMGCEITARNTGLIGSRRKDIYTETTKMMGKLLDVELSIDRKLIKQAQMP